VISPDDLAIVGVGAVTPVGCSAVESCASVRAGIARFEVDESFLPPGRADELEEDQPLVTSRVRGLPPAMAAGDRIRTLAALALADLFRTTTLGRRDLERSILALALPADDGVVGAWNIGPDLALQLSVGLGLRPRQRIAATTTRARSRSSSRRGTGWA
jgi:hypothetical protein